MGDLATAEEVQAVRVHIMGMLKECEHVTGVSEESLIQTSLIIKILDTCDAQRELLAGFETV